MRRPESNYLLISSYHIGVSGIINRLIGKKVNIVWISHFLAVVYQRHATHVSGYSKCSQRSLLSVIFGYGASIRRRVVMVSNIPEFNSRRRQGTYFTGISDK